jgi:LCP family protein required for cell wall assembly
LTPDRQAASVGRSPAVAAVLSFVWPGLGQWYEGRSQRALLYAAPVLVVAVVLVAELLAGPAAFAAGMLVPSVALTMLGLIALLGIWRAASVVEAAARPSGIRAMRGGLLTLTTVLVAAVVLTHAVAGYFAWSLYDAGSRIFVNGDPDGGTVTPDPSGPAPSDIYQVPPFATPATDQSRVTILITGIDKTTERTHSLTDTLLVVSVDPASGVASMVSFPRDIAQFPLYTGGTYQGKINSLLTWAANHPDDFPDGPLPTVARQLSFLIGIPINYYAAVDLDGFRRMIDAVGGVTVNVERPINDGFYNWLDGSPRGFYLAAGKQELNSRLALAYVRSRYGAGDNDFTRAARQQQLLIALRDKLTDPLNIGKIPGVLDVVGDTVRTNFPAERISEMVAIAQRVSGGDVKRVVLQPPTYSVHPPTKSTGGIYILRLHLAALRQLSVELYGKDSAFWSGNFDAQGTPIPLAAP